MTQSALHRMSKKQLAIWQRKSSTFFQRREEKARPHIVSQWRGAFFGGGCNARCWNRTYRFTSQYVFHRPDAEARHCSLVR
jgi:hypothetical protein